jgi:hypothetical protein
MTVANVMTVADGSVGIAAEVTLGCRAVGLCFLGLKSGHS